MPKNTMVGAHVRRKEDPRLITGSSTYVDDIHLPVMTHLAVVRSPIAHGIIQAIDTSVAEAVPGVVAVLTFDDLARIMPDFTPEVQGETSEAPNTETIPTPPVHPLARDRVRFVGEPVAAVIAVTAAIAADAAELVELDLEPLDVVVDVFAAMAEGAPQIHEGVIDNIGARFGGQRGGDVDAAFKAAQVRVKARIRNQRVSAAPMETRGVVARRDHITGGITFWSSTQAPHWSRNAVAKALGISQSTVRCVAPEVGGGFGQKIGVYAEDFIVCAAAWHLNRPVKWIETRSENLLSSSHGRDQWADVEAAADETGRLLALRARVYLDAGAQPKGLGLGHNTWIMATGCYDIPALDYEVIGVYTTTGSTWAYRGAGRPEATHTIERVIDLVADATGLDPVEVRRRNLLAPDRFPYTSLTGQTYDSGDYERTMDHALDLAGYADLRREQAKLRARGRLLGIGVSTYVGSGAIGPWESATVRVEPSGDVSIFTGISPHGQGEETAFAQMATDRVGAGFDGVVVHHGDTASTPQGNGTMGSRGLAVGGSAVAEALDTIREKATRIAAQLLEAAVEDIELADGVYRVSGVPGSSVSLGDIAGAAHGSNLPADIEAGLEATRFFRPPDLTCPFGTHVAVVEVDRDTGEVSIIRYVCVDDCGVIVSPTLVTGQIHGALAQGIGQALYEEVRYDSGGELVTGTLNDYVVPRAHHFPTFESHHTETPTPLNLLGAKGVAEAATMGSTPAIANAVIDALEPFGITHLDIPLTPQRVWSAMQTARRIDQSGQ